ncbi:ABC transporter permease [Moraxella oblonga]|uniref:ABC transporter permease n=1 Tax=Moraxella oblonga TaxID=200413 RepID=UPI00082B0AAE|nr:ABC transporter permease [Moraxella oblonga]
MIVLKNLTLTQKIGMLILLALLGFAYLTPLFRPYDMALQDLNAVLTNPNATHPLGTDHLGRDMLARLTSAIRLSFGLIVMSVGVSFTFGLSLGLLAGIFGGILDKILGFICDCIMALPGLLFILLFASIAPNSFWSLYLGVSLVMWVEFFKMARAMSLNLRHAPEVVASTLMDMGLWYIIKRHYLPRLMSVMWTLMAFGAGNAVLTLATLGFVNVGLKPPIAELGLMMTELFPYYYEAPLVFFLPIITVFLLVLSFQLLSGKQHEQ